MSDIDLGDHAGAPRDPTGRDAPDPGADRARDVRSPAASGGRAHRLRKTFDGDYEEMVKAMVS